MIAQGIISSPVGPLRLEGSEKGLKSLQIVTGEAVGSIALGHDGALNSVAEQLNAYFDGSLKEFNIPFDWSGHPDFYVSIWRVLCTIPYGRTRTYTDIAEFLQKPKLARAVGNAIAHNPLVIVIPCHRVIGKNGRLTGYIYGKHLKRQLLQHEIPGHYANQGKLFSPEIL